MVQLLKEADKSMDVSEAVDHTPVSASGAHLSGVGTAAEAEQSSEPALS